MKIRDFYLQFSIHVFTVALLKAAMLSPSGTLSLPDALAGHLSISVLAETDENWSVEWGADWLDVAPASGIGPGSIELSATGNPTVAARTASVSIGGNTILLDQPGGTHELDRETVYLNKHGSAATIRLEAASTAPWIVENSLDWITINLSSGVGPSEIEIWSDRNDNDTSRSGIIAIAGIAVEVIQNGRIVFTKALPYSQNLNGVGYHRGGMVYDGDHTLFVGNRYYLTETAFEQTREVIAYDMLTGEEKWRSEGMLSINNNCAYSAGRIFTLQGRLDGDYLATCFDASNGNILWSTNKPDYGIYPHESIYPMGLAIDFEGNPFVLASVYNESDPANDKAIAVSRLDPTIGNIEWTVSFSGRTLLSHFQPVITLSGLFVFGSLEGVTALNLTTGETVWSYSMAESSDLSSAPIVGEDGRIYFGDSDGYVHALNSVDGSVLFKRKSLFYPDAPNPMQGRSVIDPNGNILSTGGGLTCAIDGATGEVIEFLSAGYGDPAVGSDGNLFLIDPNQNAFFALKTENRDLSGEFHGEDVLWSIDLGECGIDDDSLMDHRGIYYTVTKNGTLYAIDTGSEGLADTAWPAAGGGYFNHGIQQKEASGAVPSISSEPQRLLLTTNEQGFFFPQVNGSKPISYTWSKDGSDLENSDYYEGAELKNLRIRARDNSVGGSYTLTAQNAYGTRSFSAFEVIFPPSIESISQGKIDRTAGETIEISVVVSSTVSAYQWYLDDVLLVANDRMSGTNSSTLRIENLSPGDTGKYRVVALNEAGSASLEIVNLTVRPLLSESLDNDVLEFTQSGSIAWVGDYGDDNDGEDYGTVSGSPSIADNARLETTLTGPGILSFMWYLDTTSSTDSLRLYLDDAVLPSREFNDSNEPESVSVPISEGEHVVKWEYNRVGGDPATVALDAISYSDLGENVFQALDNPSQSFSQSGDGIWLREVDWSRTNEDYLQSAALAEGESVELIMTTSGYAMEISFDWMLQSADEDNWFVLRVDDEYVESLSESTDWTTASVVLPPGEHTVKWVYRKNWGDPGESGDYVGLDHLVVLPVNYEDPGEVVGMPLLNWSLSGNRLWMATTVTDSLGDGSCLSIDSLQPNEVGRLSFELTGPGMLVFYSECALDRTWDQFKVTLNGTEKLSKSNHFAWSEDCLWIPEGTHTVEFEVSRWDFSNPYLEAMVRIEQMLFYPGNLATNWEDSFLSDFLDQTIKNESGKMLIEYTREIAHIGYTASLVGSLDLKYFLELNQGIFCWIQSIEQIDADRERVVLEIEPSIFEAYPQLFLRLQAVDLTAE